MIICSCAIVTDRDIDRAVAEIMGTTPAMLPTPGVVFRHLNKRMNCCTCAPLTVATIYQAMQRLEADTRICPYSLAEARRKLTTLEERRLRRQEFHRDRSSAIRARSRVA